MHNAVSIIETHCDRSDEDRLDSSDRDRVDEKGSPRFPWREFPVLFGLWNAFQCTNGGNAAPLGYTPHRGYSSEYTGQHSLAGRHRKGRSSIEVHHRTSQAQAQAQLSVHTVLSVLFLSASPTAGLPFTNLLDRSNVRNIHHAPVQACLHLHGLMIDI